ncbi:MAG: Helix-turn-helix domain protein [Candidatus Scalindua rubra]|uniref:Helix-turn-helix domain protein n=1 Tax=Candidatus Scalindua rubra TaxID=1872076 RepID=A0A1E3XC49_9BACT|nr:MAG: Helix-turn-helix domain protein [Candidatus Scalindua rubra]
MRPEIPQRYITLEETAEFLSCSTRTVRRLMAKGKLRFYRLGGNPRFILEEVHQAVQRTANKSRRRKRVANIPSQEYKSRPKILLAKTAIGGQNNG